jgi:hypothetical protein
VAGLGGIGRHQNEQRMEGTSPGCGRFDIHLRRGAWSFFHGTLGPGGQDLPLYTWFQYFMVLPILAGLGFIFLWEGNESGEFMITLLGILPFLGIVWYAVAKFPGCRAKH